MIELIMLCGQGSFGKSTFANKFFNKNNIISVDEILKEYNYSCYDEEIIFPIYLKRIQTAIDLNQAIIVLDFSHDSIKIRKKILNNLNFKDKNINFSAINFILDIKTLFKFHSKRINRKLTLDEKQSMKQIKKAFKPAIAEEFIIYNFNNIKIFNYKI